MRPPMFRQAIVLFKQAEQPFLLCAVVFLRSAETETAAFVGGVIELYGTSQPAAEYCLPAILHEMR